MSPAELVQFLKRDCNKMMEHFRKYGDPVKLNFNLQMPTEFAGFNILDPFAPSLKNHCILNQYIGNRWNEFDQVKDDRTEHEVYDETALMAQRRDQIMILDEQIDKIDRFRIALIKNDSPRLPSNIPRFTPLIIIAPFHFNNINLA